MHNFLRKKISTVILHKANYYTNVLEKIHANTHKFCKAFYMASINYMELSHYLCFQWPSKLGRQISSTTVFMSKFLANPAEPILVSFAEKLRLIKFSWGDIQT